MASNPQITSKSAEQMSATKITTFSKVVFFSGSICYENEIIDKNDNKVSVDDNYMLSTWNYRDYAWCLSRRFDNLLDKPDWYYLLCTQEPLVYMHGQKDFVLCRPVQPLAKMSKRTDFEDSLEEGARTVTGFQCTASLQNPSEPWRLEYQKILRTSLIPELKGRLKSLDLYDGELDGNFDPLVAALSNYKDTRDLEESIPLFGDEIYKRIRQETSKYSGICFQGVDEGTKGSDDNMQARLTAKAKNDAPEYVIEKSKKYELFKDGDDGKKKLSNSSSEVPYDQMEKFLERLDALKFGFPVFAVCDCNSFHTSGYLWGAYAVMKAIKHLDGEAPVAVINFDSHRDLGYSGRVRSDGWGRPLIEFAKEGCYVAWSGKGIKGYGYLKKGGKWEDKAKPPTDSPLDKDFWTGGTGIKSILDNHHIKYVYISVDRDCLKNHYTQWKDVPGDIKATQLEDQIEKVLNILLGGGEEPAYLIGCDVTGLPEHHTRCGKAAGNSTVWGRVADEIDKTLECVRDELLITARTAAKKKS
ncbi:MAG: hypothetical protein JSU65_12945 [Candidatus Zixiibacteriota bacterium]|nr:MAG: hypothetical protein JSU65_12945 [candidate division Zixibacteria bacterium]